MRFDSIAGTIGQDRSKMAQRKFQGLTLELGVRDNNEHVGSGLGGNCSQLFALMTYRHRLVDNTKLTIDSDTVRWGEGWLRTTKRKDMRHQLDALLPIPKGMPLTDIRKAGLGPNSENLDLLIFASRMCAKFAAELDNGDDSNTRAVALALKGFPPEIILVSVRTQIQIERLVKYNLDEAPYWSQLLSSINKNVDN